MASENSLKQEIRKFTQPLAALVTAVGLDPRRLAFLKHLPKFVRQTRRFRELGGGITRRHPILSDYEDQAGSARGHYFHQDLLVASLIFKDAPNRHIDIGSRIDGFVAHVAAFRKIDVMDVRKLDSTGHDNISFITADLMDANSAISNVADSISCLHAVEHFGLGRYGDPLDPGGHIKGFNNFVKMLKPAGKMYISFPIGKSNQVHFNAQRLFHPRDIFDWSPSSSELTLVRFDYVDDDGALHQNFDLLNSDVNVEHGCGIYTFEKKRVGESTHAALGGDVSIPEIHNNACSE